MSAADTKVPSSKASVWALIFGLLAAAGAGWLWAVSFGEYDPADWIRIAGSQVWWIGILGAVIAWFPGRKGSKAGLAHLGLALAVVSLAAFFTMVGMAY